MIFLFRKLRKMLLSKNRFTTYSLYAIGEIFLVVIGILIALQVNNWNEEQKQKHTEKFYLNSLIGDLVLDSVYLTKSISYNQNKLEHLCMISAKLESDQFNIDQIFNVTSDSTRI